jgi:hypothetical protein
MRYIQRDENGNVIGHYACPQEYAQEEVADDHPDILAWHARKQALRQRPASTDLFERIAMLEEKLARLEKPNN